MITEYFTFGINQYHTANVLELMHKKVIKITGKSVNHCREAMFKMFGAKWSNQYSEKEFKSNPYISDYKVYLDITLND